MVITPDSTSRCRLGLALRGAALTAVLLLAGCGTGTTATGAWKEPRPVDVPYHNVLVVGVSPNSRMRRSFEEQMADAIAARGTKATASVYVASEMGLGPLSKETVMAMVEKTGVDAVLVAKLVNRTVTEGQTKGDVTVKLGPQVTVVEDGNLTEVWASDYTVNVTPGQTVAKSDAKIAATLFDVADKGRVVYKIAITTKFVEVNADIIPDIAGNITTAIIGELRRDKLVE